MGKIRISSQLWLEERELRYKFIRSSGPGGQNINKVATAVQLRFDAAHSPSLPEEVRKRLLQLAGRRASRQGILLIDARRYRSQERNRDDARDRLVSLLHAAAHPSKGRRATQPSASAKRRRLEEKRTRGKLKRQRRSRAGSEE